MTERCYSVLYIIKCKVEIHDLLWNGSEEDGNVKSVRKMKVQTVKMETVTLVGKVDRI